MVSGQDSDGAHRTVVSHYSLERSFAASLGLGANRIQELPRTARDLRSKLIGLRK
jgi:hypothetical protein